MEKDENTIINAPERSDIRILEVIDNYLPLVDGVVRVVDNYAKLLNKKAECVVLAPRYPGCPNIDEYELVTCKSISGGKFGVRLPLPQFDLSLKKYLDNNHFDIIHCHSPVTLGKYIVKYAKKNNIPLVFTVHSKYHEEINSWVKSKFIQTAVLNFLLSTIKKMDYFWAVSEGSRKMLIEDYGINVDCKIMRNGCDIDDSELPPIELSEKLKQKYGIQPNDFVLLVVGRLVQVKNVDMLIDAVKILTEKNIPVKLIIVGDGNCRARLQRQAKTLGVDSKVVFTGEIKNHDELIVHYRAADLVTLASTYDTSSLTIKEAFACSVPALVVSESPAAENIVDGHNSFTAEKNAVAFSQKIEYAINNPDVLNTTKEYCHKELYTPWHTLIDNVYDEYVRIIESRKH